MARVLTCYYKPKPGGLCKRYFRAIRALLERGHDVHYLSITPFPIEHDRCHFHRLLWSPKHTEGLIFWVAFHALAPIALLLLAIRYRITHAFAFAPSYAFVLQPARLFMGIRLSFFARGDAIEALIAKNRSAVLQRLQWLVEGLAISQTQMISVSNTLQRRILARHKLLRPKSSLVIPNNIDGDLAVRRRAHGLPLRLICVGILEPSKNIQLALRTIAAMPLDCGVLHVYGNGPSEEGLKQLAKDLKIDDRVRFEGWCNSGQIWTDADILLFPSTHEGCPNSVLEAIKESVFVIAARIDELEEVLPTPHLLPLKVTEWEKYLNDICTNVSQIELRLSAQRQKGLRFLFPWDDRIVAAILNHSMVLQGG